ncbi:stage II sporulation protein D [Paenibacillus thermotolerans]|uniref:stage II sporulation protein D n=1 Tax=Paenibacillus thermotolerans TaxID=3027807 RepID=UPI002367C2E9|nr:MULTISPECIES: stage II sporulation protein D [unclassified Paenibacillus]
MRKMRTIRKRPNGMMKWQLTIAGAAVLLAVFLLIPLILVNKFEEWDKAAQAILPLQPQERLVQVEESIAVPVFLTAEKTTVSVPLEEYVRGVLAAEMPAEFELEALKAQAIAARTYIVRRLADGDRSSMPEGADSAVVTDTVVHQAYLTEQKLRDRWGLFSYAKNIDKLTKAVNETKGLIVAYEGQPIHATFFSTSDGYTEDSENYWSERVPYLRSVESPWDRLYSPKFKNTTVINRSEVFRRLGLSESKGQLSLKVIERSPTGKIMKIEAGGKVFTGREFREKLELPSTNFTWALKGKTLTFTSSGYGHGVGMSQWGANGMAKQGKSAEDILHYYYTDVDIVPLGDVLPPAAVS